MTLVLDWRVIALALLLLAAPRVFVWWGRAAKLRRVPFERMSAA